MSILFSSPPARQGLSICFFNPSVYSDLLSEAVVCCSPDGLLPYTRQERLLHQLDFLSRDSSSSTLDPDSCPHPYAVLFVAGVGAGSFECY